jgi:gamma-glutamylcyclotransferase (GGCT)/AIG2-like uncharacterized protein YtfP
MAEVSRAEVARLVACANARRVAAEGVTADGASADAEQRLDELFRPSETLAVYGTLAPGEPNHHVVAPLGGEWTEGVVEGELFPVGWGAALGYNAFLPRPGGPEVAVKVLRSPALPDAWPELDRFEGPGYHRILVPVLSPAADGERRLLTVANLYAAADERPDDPGD